jgi:hypothetical protein
MATHNKYMEKAKEIKKGLIEELKRLLIGRAL